MDQLKREAFKTLIIGTRFDTKRFEKDIKTFTVRNSFGQLGLTKMHRKAKYPK